MMNPKERPPTDYRGMRKRNELWLLIAATVVLTALPCLLAGAGAIAGLYLFFAVLGRWADG